MRALIRHLVFRALPLILFPLPALAGLAPPPGITSGPDLPEPLRSAAAWAFALQHQLNVDMRHHLAAMKETGSWEPAAAILLAAFLYGIFHAVGPGHGKVVIGSYFATRRARIGHGLIASLIAAFVQAGSAILIVGALAGALALAPSQVMAKAGWVETGSYAMIALVGLSMLWRTATGLGCGHDHGGDCGHDHHEKPHTGCCGHAHAHNHGNEHEHPPRKPARDIFDRRALFGVATAVGFRPCSGAILVLLFTFSNHMYAVGVLATLAMGLGVALTVSAIGMGALGLNRLLERGFGQSDSAGRIRTGLALAGALTITIMGAVLLAGSLANGPALTG